MLLLLKGLRWDYSFVARGEGEQQRIPKQSSENTVITQYSLVNIFVFPVFFSFFLDLFFSDFPTTKTLFSFFMCFSLLVIFFFGR